MAAEYVSVPRNPTPAMIAAGVAARAAARDAAGAAAWAAAWAAARDAAAAAAWAAARDALNPTTTSLQASAHVLFDRMIRVTEADVAPRSAALPLVSVTGEGAEA
ncbi:MAG: hypothetical protein AB7G13_11605 [Lautropia sp.]